MLKNLAKFLLVFGPGFVVMEADNDAGGVQSYMQAGAQFGWSLAWVTVLLLPITFMVQELAMRLGIISGKGHMALIKERFGKIWAWVAFADLFILNFLTLLTEFAAISSICDALHINRTYGLALMSALSVAVIMWQKYRIWEILMILMCALDTAWFVWLYYHPTWDIVPKVSNLADISTWGTVMALIGTTIAPWQIFFQQRCVVDKGLGKSELFDERVDTFLSSVFTILAALAMMGAGVYFWKGFADPTSGSLFTMVMWSNAAFLGTVCVSLSSSWSFSEMFGEDSSLNHIGKKFLGVYVLAILSASIFCYFSNSLDWDIIAVQILSAILLPLSIGIMVRLLAGMDAISTWYEVVMWGVIAVLTGTTLWGI